MEWRGAVIVVLMGWLVLSAEVMQSEGAVPCTTVTRNTFNCLNYVRGAAKMPNSACCQGVKTLDGLASTLQNRRDICTCLQNSAKIFKPIPSAVSALPSQCGATHPFSLSQNCATIP